ncbi:DUF2180 family protein [Cellulomonas sp. Marseille-Q8402]
MFCYEDAKFGDEVPAVAFCKNCGAGVCAAHVQECVATGITSTGVGAPVVRPDGRVLHCLTCHRAAPCGTSDRGRVAASRAAA